MEISINMETAEKTNKQATKAWTIEIKKYRKIYSRTRRYRQNSHKNITALITE